jgi:hypothetical protein
MPLPPLFEGAEPIKGTFLNVSIVASLSLEVGVTVESASHPSTLHIVACGAECILDVQISHIPNRANALQFLKRLWSQCSSEDRLTQSSTHGRTMR